MPTVRRYFTGLIAQRSELRGLSFPIRGAGWTLTFRKSSRTETIVHGREAILTAHTWEAAQRALGLILSATRLMSGEPYLFADLQSELVAHNSQEPELESSFRHVVEGHKAAFPGIPTSCRVAAKASRRRQWVYALTKYAFSVRLYGAFVVDLDPSTGRHLPLSAFPQDHIAFAHAIVAAHSAVEDLGLEVRASRERASKINGEWNPVVKQDLERRLLDSGVSLNEKVLWTIRGRGTAVHARRRPQPTQRAPWSRGPYVRDGEVDGVEAIAYLDWLRDRIATHASKRLTRSLSPYDVVNVQHLVRMLLLQAMGFWRRPLVL